MRDGQSERSRGCAVTMLNKMYAWSLAECTSSNTIQSVTRGWFPGRGLAIVTSMTNAAFARAYVGVEPLLQIIISRVDAKSDSSEPRASFVAEPQLAEWALKSPATMRFA